MGNSVRLRALALITTGLLGLGSLGGVAFAAAADPKADHTDQGKHLGQTKDQDQDQGAQGDNGRHNGHAHAPGQQSDPGHQGGQHGQSGVPHGHSGERGQGTVRAHGDPAGNNGTVKIAGPADEVGHPSNNPHPGCTFYVEWFGFDEGADVVSTVTFTSQAPTADVVLGGTSPAQVFVGGDPAGGGTDLDGRQAYTLSFQGEPHPNQGYHVKLTVATPRSLGNDTKTKVFWVEPCAPAAAGTAAGRAALGGRAPGVGSGTLANGGRGSGGRGADVTTDQGVLGETYTADTTVAAGVAADEAAVPTAVDAGEDSMLPAWAQSPLPLTLISFALVLAGVGIVVRNRSRA